MARKKKKISLLGKYRKLFKNYSVLLTAYTTVVAERNAARERANALGYFARKLRRAAADNPDIGMNNDILQVLAFLRTMLPPEEKTND